LQLEIQFTVIGGFVKDVPLWLNGLEFVMVYAPLEPESVMFATLSGIPTMLI
jgi:hypothetical protein